MRIPCVEIGCVVAVTATGCLSVAIVNALAAFVERPPSLGPEGSRSLPEPKPHVSASQDALVAFWNHAAETYPLVAAASRPNELPRTEP